MTSVASIRAVLVEDEPHARRNLREYAEGVEWLTIVGEAADGVEAVRLLDEVRPDLVFLDVSLPELSGLEVAHRVRELPEVVFTTAHDRHALAAFELGAIDYLLKPFGRERFLATLERVRRRLAEARPSQAERLRGAMGRPLRRLFVRTREGIVPLDVRDIVHVQAAGDYAEVFCERVSHLVHLPLAELAASLDPDRFRQVHRSHVVNLDAVELIRPFDARRLVLQLRGGKEIVASRAASEELRKLAR